VPTSPRRADADPPAGHPGLGLSIAYKLPLFIDVLVTVVIAVNTWGDYRSGVKSERVFAAIG